MASQSEKKLYVHMYQYDQDHSRGKRKWFLKSGKIEPHRRKTPFEVGLISYNISFLLNYPSLLYLPLSKLYVKAT